MEKLEDSAKEIWSVVKLNGIKYQRVEKGPATIYKPVGIDTSKDIDYYL
ncbi:hypothetical protein K9L16_01955 [Candidatus Pacearchaeota archaeon]|nr:hypothetical protein [Candidatus Pacearchaeota archaeon]